jgi:hypothetical protein
MASRRSLEGATSDSGMKYILFLGILSISEDIQEIAQMKESIFGGMGFSNRIGRCMWRDSSQFKQSTNTFSRDVNQNEEYVVNGLWLKG